MSWLEALLLGVVEGLTEYLPVSSTGHLLLTQRLLGIEATGAANAYAICIQAGAIVAVLGLYHRRVAQVLRGVLGRDEQGLGIGRCLLAAFLPAAVLGLTCAERIEELFFGLWPIVFAWFVGGVLVLLIRGRGRRSLRLSELGWQAALVIGACQCVAVWPGTSRSLVTIVGGLLVGLRLSAAVEFSFLLGVITLLAATAYSAVSKGGLMLEEYGALPLLVGFAASWLFAVLSVRWMVHWLSSHGMAVFGWYRVVLALVVTALILGGQLVT